MSNQQPISTFLGIAAAVVLAADGHAAIINVPGDFGTIQAAIADPGTVAGDEIVVAPGTYFEAINFLGKAITVRSSGGAAVTTIDGGGVEFHVVQCVSGEGPDTVLDGFTITGGNANGPDFFSDKRGGGMYIDGSSPTVTNCDFIGNMARFGGGMFNDFSSPTVSNCTFTGNFAISTGGGMSNLFDSNPTVTDCMFTGNSALGGGSNSGGGMFNSGSNPVVTNCTFVGNIASHGGGMNNSNFSDPVVTNCTFADNTGLGFGRGAGMYNDLSSPTVTNCTFTGNTTAILNGAGMYNESFSNPAVTNCTFVGNIADGRGGGMANIDNSSPTVTNCTFAENTANANIGPRGGGMVNDFSSSPTVTNCILWNNVPDPIAGSGTGTVTHSDVEGGWKGEGNISADPLFVDPNGRLAPDSPCIDAGDNTAVPEDITTDLDGNPRFVDDPDTPDCQQAPGTCGDPPVVDMGAYEFQPPVPPCPWDLTGDGVVNVLDLIDLVMSFGPCEDCPADFDDDGFVNVLDLIALIMNFGPCPGTECVWDVNDDGVVDESDVQAVTSNLGPCGGCPEDINGDGVVDGQDVAAVTTHFGPCP